MQTMCKAFIKLIVDKNFNKFQCSKWHTKNKTKRVADNFYTFHRKNKICLQASPMKSCENHNCVSLQGENLDGFG